MSRPLPVLLSIPHGGRLVPPEVRSIDALDDDDRFHDGDACTREIYDVGDLVTAVVTTDIARAYVDLNRAADDRPPDNPDGVVKSQTACGTPVYRTPLDPEIAEQLLSRYYAPYHASIESKLAGGDVKLVVDCHSMAEHPPPLASDDRPRPLFCISNGAGTTSEASLLDSIGEALAEAFELDVRDVAHNEPFLGGYITRRHGRGATPAVQIEMNRRLYLVEPWFDADRLVVEEARLVELRSRFAQALERFCPAL